MKKSYDDKKNNASQDRIESYRSGVIFKNKYIREHQVQLKERVFLTYNRLLMTFAEESIESGCFLDTGSAGGAFAEVCNQNGIVCQSLDIDNGVDFETDAFPFPDGCFDFVNANSVIEHLNNPSIYLREIYRVLKPGGYLFVVTPHWPYAWKKFYNTFTHLRPYSYKSLEELFLAYSFESMALVPWVVEKNLYFWKLPKPFCFWVVKYCLLFRGDNRWAPGFLKGKSDSLLALAKKPLV